MSQLAEELFKDPKSFTTPLEEVVIEGPLAPRKGIVSRNYKYGKVAKKLNFGISEASARPAPVCLVQTVALPPVGHEYVYQLVFFMRNGERQKGFVTKKQKVLEDLPTVIGRNVGKIESWRLTCNDKCEITERELIEEAIYGTEV